MHINSTPKHAYLIMAHNEFEVLKKLVYILDDERNDIFIHYDAKVKNIPEITTQKSSLIVLNDRVSVYWGGGSQLEAEYKLWEASVATSTYLFYHLISGTHFPLKSQSEIHSFYDNLNKSVFQRMETDNTEIDAKIRRYNVFNDYMMSNRNPYSYKIGRFLWNLFLKPQKILGIKRYTQCKFYKASQWASLKHDAVLFLLKNKRKILLKYQYSFCSDEFFVLSELMDSPLKDELFYADHILKQDFVSTNPKIYLFQDYDYLMNSGCIYARKFSHKSLSLLDRITENMTRLRN